MNLKNYLKKKLGDNYYNFRLNRILEKVLGKKIIYFNKLLNSIKNKFNFIYFKLNKKIGFQSIVTKEKGFFIDLTKDNFFFFI